MTRTNDREPDAGEMLDTLVITKNERRHLSTGGTWVTGTMAGHCFEALVFPDHAEHPAYELGDSRISKLWVQQIEDRVTVFNWDRGMDIEPQTDEARTIVGLFEAGLAEHVFGE